MDPTRRFMKPEATINGKPVTYDQLRDALTELYTGKKNDELTDEDIDTFFKHFGQTQGGKKSRKQRKQRKNKSSKYRN